MRQTISVGCVAVAVSQFNYHQFPGQGVQGAQTTADGHGSVSSQYNWHQYVPGTGPSNGQQYDWHRYADGGNYSNTGQNIWHQYAPNTGASGGHGYDWHQYMHTGTASGAQNSNWQHFVPQGRLSGGQFDWQKYADQYRQNHTHPWEYYVHTYGNNYSIHYSNAWRDVTSNTTHIWQNNASEAHSVLQLCSFYSHQTAVLQTFTPSPFQHWGHDNLGNAVLTNLARLHNESNGSIAVANCSGESFGLVNADRHYSGPRDASDASSERELKVWRAHAQAKIRRFVPLSYQNVSLADVDSEYQHNLDRINSVNATAPSVAVVTDAPVAAAVVTMAPAALTAANAFLSESPVKHWQPASPILMLALLAGIAVSAVTVGSRQRRGVVASEPLLTSDYTALP